MNSRIKKLRKVLDLTQNSFAERIGLKQNSIALIESGKRNISDQAVLSICREFRVNESWLRYGDGEMFLPQETNIMSEMAARYHLSPDAVTAIEVFAELPDAARATILDYLRKVAKALDDPATPMEPIVQRGVSIVTGKKITAAARSGDRMEGVELSPEEEDALLPPPYTGDL